MCDRFGCDLVLHKPRLARRGFLATAAATTLTMALGPAQQALAQGGAMISSRGTGFCNLNLFLAHAMQFSRQDGVALEFVNAPTFAEQVTFLGMGQSNIGVLPYTSALSLIDGGAPIRIIAGGGVEGCVLVAQKGLDSAAKLRGKTLGTFQLDTLEVLPYDWLKKNGVSLRDVNVRYMGSTPEAAEAFRAGALDWIATIEPYGTALLNDVPGAVKLSDGTDLYGRGYTDCVLAARSEVIERNPQGVKAIIKAMMQAQAMFEQHPEEALPKLVGSYYKTSMENARLASSKQPSVVDARSQSDFILGRVQSLIEMGYAKKAPSASILDWRLLEQVIAENKALYDSLKWKSAA
ncbi:ABC transporter substrate-binding protein [Roseomonas sp. GC11]|uniref:ABC transporter substrate-binding protein n=1 Tax=Roseomonas sp. GC11 TaxID=2950546 RepID=UPI00210DD8BA|nr:ABC transporter substrate-binding protein [Roseomonas sp. GC11]MCQ4159046.1 ABC transporter substrate-binding protein [Roseomonas sp. GC11]